MTGGTSTNSRSRSLPWFLAERAMMAVPLLLLIVCINFVLIRLAPGDPVSVLFGNYAPSAEQAEIMTRKMSLDQPLHVQLGRYVLTVLQGDLGYSFVSQQNVATLIWERFPATALLVLVSLLTYTALGLLMAVFTARNPYSGLDAAGSTLALIGYSIPVFWLGQLALSFFGMTLGWLPTQGMTDVRNPSSGLAYGLDVAAHLILPSAVLGSRYLAVSFRLARASLIEALQQDYVTASRAYGLSEAVVTWGAWRNAVLPVITMFGLNFGDVLAGSVLVEIVFGWPGLGRLMYDAMFNRDYPLLMGLFVSISVGIVVVNLAVDCVYALVDPRIGHG